MFERGFKYTFVACLFYIYIYIYIYMKLYLYNIYMIK